jgi:hypothetical protein
MFNQRVGTLVLILFTSIFVPAIASAQDVTSCPANVLLASGRASAACANVVAGQACYGNGDVNASLWSTDVALLQPGQRVSVEQVAEIRTQSDVASNQWSVATMRLRFGEGEAAKDTYALIFGNVSITNRIQPFPTMRVESGGLLNVRVEPTADADIIEQFGIRTTFTANGISNDGAWVRVRLPDSDQLGWAARDLVNPRGDIMSLDVVAVGQETANAFEVMTLATGQADAFCEQATESGILLQSPDVEDPVQLKINGIDVRFAGTIYLQTQTADTDTALVIHTLDGSAGIHDETDIAQFILAGSRAVLQLGERIDIEPYDLSAMQALPVNNLPVRFAIAEPTSDVSVPVWAIEPTAIPTADPAIERNRCTFTVIRNANLYAGPGTIYEVINNVSAGTRVNPVLETPDADGAAWWQLRGSNWIAARDVEVSEACEPVPRSQIVDAPRFNTLSLETCETSNGPLRAGQRVTITFVPPSWSTLEEARLATSVSPGAVIIDNRQYLPTYASAPIKLSDEAYIREFSADWVPDAGTYRIVGARRSYLLICNLTIPLGP